MNTVHHPAKPSAPESPLKPAAPAPQRGPESQSDAGEEDPGAALDMPGTREAMTPGAPPAPREGFKQR